jgi:hypothetical protein
MYKLILARVGIILHSDPHGNQCGSERLSVCWDKNNFCSGKLCWRMLIPVEMFCWTRRLNISRYTKYRKEEFSQRSQDHQYGICILSLNMISIAAVEIHKNAVLRHSEHCLCVKVLCVWVFLRWHEKLFPYFLDNFIIKLNNKPLLYSVKVLILEKDLTHFLI